MLYETISAIAVTAVVAIIYLQRRRDVAGVIPPGYRAGYSQRDEAGLILCAIYHPDTLDTLAIGQGTTEREALADALSKIGGGK